MMRIETTSRSYRRQTVKGAAFHERLAPGFHALASVATVFVLTLLMGCSDQIAIDEPDESTSHVVEVEVAAAEFASLDKRLELVGTLLPIRGATIVPEVEGVIESFPDSPREVRYLEGGQIQSRAFSLDLGHEVNEGDILVELKKESFLLSLAAAQARLDLANRQLEELEAPTREEEVCCVNAELNRANAILARAESGAERYLELWRDDVISQGEYDDKLLAVETAKAGVAAAQAAVDMAAAGPTPQQIEVAKASVAAAQAEVDLRQDDLRKTTIRCPYDAVITDRFANIGDRVQPMPRTEIVQIADPSALLAQICVPERYQDSVRMFEDSDVTDETRQVWIHAESLDDPLPGRVDLINAMIDPETRTFRVRVTIDNRQRLLKPGGFVRVSLPVATRSDVLCVPVQAIVADSGSQAVFVLVDGHVEKRSVTVGLMGRTACEIRAGLQRGDEVAVGHTALLSDGLVVRRKTADALDAGASDALAVEPRQAEDRS